MDRKWYPANVIGVIGRILTEILHFVTPKPATRPGAAASDGQAWTLERRLEALAECGVRLSPGMTAADVAAAGYVEGKSPRWSDPWEHLLSCLGENRDSDSEGDDQPPLSNDVLTWDSECVYDDGDYAAFVNEVARIAKGHLPARDVVDHIGADGAWLELTLDDERHRLSLALNGDWMDPETTAHLGRLLEARAPDWCLGGASMGQAMVLTCLRKDEMAKLEQLTGLKLR